MMPTQTYKGWTTERRVWAIHWLLTIIWLTQLILLIGIAAILMLVAP